MKPSAIDALRLLSADDFVSGQRLAQHLGCSRASVHNLLGVARDLGLSVHAVPGRGYRLAEPLTWLDADWLDARLAPLHMTLELHPQLPSTNSHLLELARAGAPHRRVVAAEWQHAGRGRRGRTWRSPFGQGLAFSLLWRSAQPVAALSGLSLAVGVILAQALQRAGVLGARVKWPNDLLVADAKLGGILIELTGDMLGPSVAVIGVGLNVSGARALAAMLDQPATDVVSHGGGRDRNALLLSLLQALNHGLERFDQSGFAGFMADWNACHAYHGRMVELVQADATRLPGEVAGVDASGALLLRTAHGLHSAHSGEVSLRPGPA